MKTVGVIAILVGIVVAIVALNMDTSVATGLGERVNNIGLMDQRRNILIVGSLVILVGVVLLGFASVKGNSADASTQVGYKACPYCAEPVRVEAKICKHCQRELPVTEAPVAAAATQQPAVAPENCFNCAYYDAKSRWDKSVGKCTFHNKRTYASDTCGDFVRKVSA